MRTSDAPRKRGSPSSASRLTSIRAATTALLASPDQKTSSANQMLRIADEEATHLEELIDNALDLAQLDSDHIDVEMEPSNLDDVVREVISSMKTKIGDRRLCSHMIASPFERIWIAT